MSEQRTGYYQDEHGNWLKDRRQSDERRSGQGGSGEWPHHDRRLLRRRKTDLEFRARDARDQVRDALNEFAETHDAQGHPLGD